MKDLGLSVNQIIRYGFGGLLLFLLMAIIEPAWTWEKVHILGPVFVPFIALGIGMLLYVFYRPILGRCIFWPLFDQIHACLECTWGYKKGQADTHNCKKQYLTDKYGVTPANNAIDAFRIIRNEMFDKEIADSFETQHSEIHLLYITCILLILATLYLYFIKDDTIWLVFSSVMAVWCLIMGMKADIDLCRIECAYLKTLPEHEITNLLRRAGYSKL